MPKAKSNGNRRARILPRSPQPNPNSGESSETESSPNHVSTRTVIAAFQRLQKRHEESFCGIQFEVMETLLFLSRVIDDEKFHQESLYVRNEDGEEVPYAHNNNAIAAILKMCANRIYEETEKAEELGMKEERIIEGREREIISADEVREYKKELAHSERDTEWAQRDVEECAEKRREFAARLADGATFEEEPEESVLASIRASAT